MSVQPFVEVLLLLGATVLVVGLLQRLRIPSVLGYLIVGVVLGPDPGTRLESGDVVVLFGAPEDLERAESRLLA